MANEQNLRPCEHKLTEEEAKRGGIASGKARAEKRDLRKALEILLEKTYPKKDKNGNVIGETTGTEAITAKLFEQAMKGNIKAFETIRDSVGQKPMDKVIVAEVDPAVMDDLEKELYEDKS